MFAQLERSAYADAAERDRARVLTMVFSGLGHSRAEISLLLGLRSSTASRTVGELVEMKLMLETSGEKAGRGRPATTLSPNPRRVGASVILVSGKGLVGTVVDLAGQPIRRILVPIERDADNASMSALIAAMAADLRRAIPKGMLHAGTAAAIAGVLDAPRGILFASSRFPRVRNLDVGAALYSPTTPHLLTRPLEAELRAILHADPERYRGGTVLVHWGWGIGASYAVDDALLDTGGKSFGELGHWRLAELTDRPCGCGNTGCLETVASLRVLLPILRTRFPDLSDDETELGEQLRGRELDGLAELEIAGRLVMRTLANLCRLLFPERVIISGPLAKHPFFWARCNDYFRDEGSLCGLSLPILLNETGGEALTLQGAAEPLLREAVQNLLRTENG